MCIRDRQVELLAGVVLDADVVHRHVAAGHRLGAIADDDVLDHQFSRRGTVGKFNLGFSGHG